MNFRRHRLLRHSAGSIARGWLVVVAGIAAATAQTELDADDAQLDSGDSGGIFSGGLLPNGSILKDVVLPSYDSAMRLATTVTAGELTIFTRDEEHPDPKTGEIKIDATLDRVDAEDLEIRFFHPDRSLQGTIAMPRAKLELRGRITLLSTDDPVSFVSEDLKVDGSGLAFDTGRNRGFIHGPVTAVARTTDTRTSMNATPVQRALAAGAMLMAAAPALPAQEPAREPTSAERFAAAKLTPDELAQLERDKASRAPAIAAEREATQKDIVALDAESARAGTAMGRFFRAAALTAALAEPAPEAPADVPRPAALSEEGDTVVKAKDGAYFDAREGLLIFLGDVTVKNPQLDLKGAAEVKVFLESTPAEADSAGNEKPADPVSDGLGDVKRIVATGPAVHIRFDPGKGEENAVEASAHAIVYDFEARQVRLQGGSPWVFQDGGLRVQAQGNNAYIVIHTDADGNPTKAVVENQGGGSTFNLKVPKR